MKNYKEYDRELIGDSDYATLVLAGCVNGGGLELKPLNFGEDGRYTAYIVDEEAKIGKHYKLTYTFNSWLRIYDDTSLVQTFRADEIRVYKAGQMGCIIQLIGNKDE